MHCGKQSRNAQELWKFHSPRYFRTDTFYIVPAQTSITQLWEEKMETVRRQAFIIALTLIFKTWSVKTHYIIHYFYFFVFIYRGKKSFWISYLQSYGLWGKRCPRKSSGLSLTLLCHSSWSFGECFPVWSLGWWRRWVSGSSRARVIERRRETLREQQKMPHLVFQPPNIVFKTE